MNGYSLFNPIFWLVDDANIYADEEKLINFQDALSPLEKALFKKLRFTKRQMDWMIGRLTAKKLLLNIYGRQKDLKACDFSILNHNTGAPYVLLHAEEPLEGSLSISHSQKIGFCAYTPHAYWQVGADIEQIENHSYEFIMDYFTLKEIENYRMISENLSALYTTSIWSAKEAVLKALQVGLNKDTREVEIDLPYSILLKINELDWQQALILQPKQQSNCWHLWLKKCHNFVITLALLHNRGEENINLVDVQSN